jgi:peptidyl-prolyl cis-trans isomerase D
LVAGEKAMLTYMRKNAGSWIIKVLFAAIIITFVFFYGYGPEKGPDERVLATVGTKKITTVQYRTAYANMLEMYQQMYQNQITDTLARALGLRQNLLDEMIEHALLLQEAERRKLQVSREEIKNAVMQQPYFHENGVFSERRYADVLSRMKMTAAEYERQAEQEQLLKSMREMLLQAVSVSEQELFEFFRLRGERLNIAYVEFSQSDISDDLPVSQDELQAHYDQNAEQYRISEMVDAHYIVFDPKDYVGRMHVEEEEIKVFYAADQTRFYEPEQIRARHILLKADSAAEPEKAQAARAQANALLEQINGGADFAELAKKYSQDEATAATGGDLGFFGRGVMVGPFDDAAFALQPGETSDVVETRFGFHIIRLEEKKPARLQPFDDVRAEIVRELQQEMAEREVRTASRRAFNRLFSSRDLEGYAQQEGLSLRTTGLFSYGSGPEDAQSENAFSRQAFALSTDELSPVFAINKKYYLLKLAEKKPSHIPPLEDVIDDVRSAVQRKKRFERARQMAQDALAMLAKPGVDWDTVAGKYRLEIKQAELTRTGDSVPGLGRNPELKAAAFALEDGQTADRVFTTDSSHVLVRALSRTVPPEENFENEKELLRQQLVQAKQQEAFNRYIQSLKERYSVSVDVELFEAL